MKETATLIIRAITVYSSSILLLQLLDSIRRDIRFTRSTRLVDAANLIRLLLRQHRSGFWIFL